jgi:hypothetical protein
MEVVSHLIERLMGIGRSEKGYRADLKHALERR